MADCQPQKLILLCCLLWLAACSEQGTDKTDNNLSLQPLPVAQLASWHLGQAQQTANQATQLVNATDAFLKQPDAANRERWQQSWIRAHSSWLQASILIPDTTGRIDHWPMEPGFVDSLPAYPDSGIVHDLIVDLDPESLATQHQITDDSEVALGFHVLEYYAFERDLASFDDTATGAERRRTLIRQVSTLLLKDLLTYSRQFFSGDGDMPEVLPLSLSSLLPMLQDRTESIYDAYRQLGEHSPFAARSTQDIRDRLIGLRRLLTDAAPIDMQLIQLDNTLGNQFIDTLDEALSLLPEEGEVPESDAPRLLLLLSAMTHQGADLARISGAGTGSS